MVDESLDGSFQNHHCVPASLLVSMHAYVQPFSVVICNGQVVIPVLLLLLVLPSRATIVRLVRAVAISVALVLDLVRVLVLMILLLVLWLVMMLVLVKCSCSAVVTTHGLSFLEILRRLEVLF